MMHHKRLACTKEAICATRCVYQRVSVVSMVIVIQLLDT